MLINTVHSSHICVRICECPSSMLGVCSPTQILLKLYFYSRMFDSTKTTALPLSVARHRHQQCVVSTAPLHMCLHNVCTQHTFNAMHTAHTQFAKCVNNRGRAREWETKQKKKLKTALIKLLLLNEWVFFFSSVHAMCWVCVCVWFGQNAIWSTRQIVSHAFPHSRPLRPCRLLAAAAAAAAHFLHCNRS